MHARFRAIATTLVLSLSSVAAAAPAARGFIELSGGIAQPIADEDYTDLIDTSFKLALRGGAWLTGDRATRLGFEIGADYTFGNFDGPNVDARRLRLLGGFRGLAAIGAGIGLVFRAVAGIDYASYDADVSIFSIDGSDVGFGVEVGGGLIFNVARTVYVGAQVAVPIGFHSAEDEGIDFTSVDLDVLFSLGLGF